MNIDELISSVYVRRPIWDRKAKEHSNRNVIEKLWKEVSTEMDVEENVLRKKWKYLRDQFAVELGKTRQRSEDSGENVPTKWPYFKSLIFLKNVVKPRINPGNLCEVTLVIPQNDESESQPSYQENDESEEESFKEECNLENETVIEIEDRDDSDDRSNPPFKKQRLSQHENLNYVINLEHLKYLQEIKSQRKIEKGGLCEDELFFKSLLPHVQKIENSRKMSFRIRVQQLVDEFVYPQPLTYFSSTSTP